MPRLRRLTANGAAREDLTPQPHAPGAGSTLQVDDLELAADIGAAIDRRLAALAATNAPRQNVSFIINCRARLKERRWDFRRQRRVCAALEQKYLAAGWKQASIYVMEHDHLRVRVTLRALAGWERTR